MIAEGGRARVHRISARSPQSNYRSLTTRQLYAIHAISSGLSKRTTTTLRKQPSQRSSSSDWRCPCVRLALIRQTVRQTTPILPATRTPTGAIPSNSTREPPQGLAPAGIGRPRTFLSASLSAHTNITFSTCSTPDHISNACQRSSGQYPTITR